LTLLLHTVGVRELQNASREPRSRQEPEGNFSKPEERPKVIDLFAGVGGFSLGAARAGFDVAVAIDLDRHAVTSHEKNFPHTKHRRRDIAKLTGDALLRIANLGSERIAGIIGGPPCQGFSTMGRRRKNDKRNPLFFHFFRLVSEIRPLFFIAENVPGLLDPKYDRLRSESLKLVSEDYNILGPFVLCPSDFGAATVRPRVFFVGVDKRTNKSLSLDDFSNEKPQCKNSVRTALSGLRRVKPGWQSEKQSWRTIEEPDSDFFVAINRLCSGSVGDPKAISRFTEKLEVSGFFGTRHRPDVVERFSAVLPGKRDKISRFPRLKWDGFCPTLRAGTDSSRGSYQAVRPIHPDEPRVIAPREAARLQGFPDWFQFSPTKWHSFRQIGNSISPLVAEHVLRTMHRNQVTSDVT